MKNQGVTLGFALKRSTIAVGLALGLGAASPHAYAFGFGEPVVSTVLGQALQMRIPLQPDPEVDLSPQCLRLLGNPHDSIPTLTMARLNVEEDGKNRTLRITSLNPIDEPILRVIVEAGCAQHVQREFTVLLDPPVPYVPTAVPAAVLAAAPTALGAARRPGGDADVAAPDAAPATELPAAAELELGAARIQGRIGQPLFLQIPITGQGAATLDEHSVRSAQILNSDGTPLRNPTQLSVSHTSAGAMLLLATADAVVEPALRVVVELATPTRSIHREYGVLLEMPAAPSVAIAAAEPAPAGQDPLAPATTTVPDTQADSLLDHSKPRPSANPDLSSAAPPASDSAPSPAPATVKPRRHGVRHAPGLAPSGKLSAVAAAPANGNSAEPAQSAAASSAAASKAASQPIPNKPAGGGDHLVLSTAEDPAHATNGANGTNEANAAAAQHFAEMDQRVKDLTQEIVKLRADLTAQKQREAELVAQQSHPGGSWLLALLGVLGVSVGALILWTRSRGNSSWRPAAWEAVAGQHAESAETQQPTRGRAAVDEAMHPARMNETMGWKLTATAASESAEQTGATAGHSAPRNTGKSTDSKTGQQDPLTISALVTPIEVTEVLAHEPSVEQLYTLFYDIGGNSTSGGTGAPAARNPASTALPTVALPKRDALNLDLGIPESIQSAKAARAQNAIKGVTALPASGSGAKSTTFTYKEPAVSGTGQAASGPDPDPPTNVGPMTEIPRDAEFARTQPSLDLDLTTHLGIGATTQLGPLTEIPVEERFARTHVDSAWVRGLDAERRGFGTSVSRSTDGFPEEEEPKTRVELDLDLNTNVLTSPPHPGEDPRESDPFPITTVPGHSGKRSN